MSAFYVNCVREREIKWNVVTQRNFDSAKFLRKEKGKKLKSQKEKIMVINSVCTERKFHQYGIIQCYFREKKFHLQGQMNTLRSILKDLPNQQMPKDEQ